MQKPSREDLIITLAFAVLFIGLFVVVAMLMGRWNERRAL